LLPDVDNSLPLAASVLGLAAGRLVRADVRRQLHGRANSVLAGRQGNLHARDQRVSRLRHARPLRAAPDVRVVRRQRFLCLQRVGLRWRGKHVRGLGDPRDVRQRRAGLLLRGFDDDVQRELRGRQVWMHARFDPMRLRKYDRDVCSQRYLVDRASRTE